MTHNMSEEEREIFERHAKKSFNHHLKYSAEESFAYSTGWEHAMEYANELITLRNRKQLEQMSDDEFNAFLRNQLGGDK